jgi:type IV fimbrial biogenesis protein FimT
MASSTRDRGFTLIEVVVVLAVGAMVYVAAGPYLMGWVNAAAASSAREAMSMSLMLARNEAIKRNSRVVVCKSASGIVCSSTGRWDQGWLVFHDEDNDATRDSNEALLLHQSGFGAGVVVSGNSPVAKYLSYTATGSARFASGGLQMGTLTVCPLSEKQVSAHEIVVSTSGRPRIHQKTVASCL